MKRRFGVGSIPGWSALSFAVALAPSGLGCSRSEAPAPPAPQEAPREAAANVPAAPSVQAALPTLPGLLAVGASAPDVTFHFHTGAEESLASFRGKPVVVYFYPKDDTPGCTIEAQEIRDLYQPIRDTGAVVIGVSVDAREQHQAFAEKYGLPFLLATDESGTIAQAFGVPLRNGRATRVSFVVDAAGKVTRVFDGVKPSGHGAELLAALKG